MIIINDFKNNFFFGGSFHTFGSIKDKQLSKTVERKQTADNQWLVTSVDGFF